MPDSSPSTVLVVNPDGTVRFPIVDQPNVWTKVQEFQAAVTFDSTTEFKGAVIFDSTTEFKGGATFDSWADHHGQILQHFGVNKFDVLQDFRDAAGNVLYQLFKGGAESGTGWGNGQQPATMVLPGGDLINIRNVQGGIFVSGQPELLNLDLGAGNSTAGQRGNIGVNYDVGRGLVVYDGSLNRVFSINETADNSTGNGLIQSFLPQALHGSGVFINGSRSGETYPRIQITDDGFISWGTGATPLQASTLLHPNGITGMKFDGGLIVGGNLEVNNPWSAVADTPINGYFVMTVNGVSRRVPTI